MTVRLYTWMSVKTTLTTTWSHPMMFITWREILPTKESMSLKGVELNEVDELPWLGTWFTAEFSDALQAVNLSGLKRLLGLIYASARWFFELLSIKSFDSIMIAVILASDNFFVAKMATVPQEIKVKTLEGEMLAVEVAPTNTVKELRAMLLESKRGEDSIERQLLRVEVLTAGLLLDDDQTVESAGLLCAESDVTVVYARREVEAATKEGIHEEGPLGVIVPSHVMEIKNLAFADCQQVLRVTVPESVTSIGENAFAGCQSLARITLPESLTVIEPCAFLQCTSLESVTIPESVTSIGDSAFAECTSLKHITLPKSLISISSTTFEGCEGLTSIVIPGWVKFIEESAFFRCYSLESVTLPDWRVGIWRMRIVD